MFEYFPFFYEEFFSSVPDVRFDLKAKESNREKSNK